MKAEKTPPAGAPRAHGRVPPLLAALEGGRRWLLFAVLLLLHAVVVQGVETVVGRVLLLGHLGLFLLWQPIVHAETRLRVPQLAAVILVCAALVTRADTLMLMIWVAVLAGIVGGKVYFFEERPVRVAYLLTLGYLVTILLARLTPELLVSPGQAPDVLKLLTAYVLPLVLPVLVFLPEGAGRSDRAEIVDFVYSAFVFLLLAVLVLGSLALMQLTGRGYFESLLLALAAISVVLLVLGWAWNPGRRFGGLGLLFSRHALSFGIPFEEWLARLNAIAGRESDPERFLGEACLGLAQLPGVKGGRWRVGERSEFFAEAASTVLRFDHPAVTIELMTSGEPGPTLRWHYNLLVQLVAEFYVGRVRARELEQMSYVRAVHETGARLTHDVKNLLQSLNTLCYAAGQEGEESSSDFQALLRRQLPAITRRLEQTLAKLKRPDADSAAQVPATLWWRDLRRRYGGEAIRFSMTDEVSDALVVADLFNGVVENLVQNALAKQVAGRPVRVSVKLESGPVLTVCDDGEPVPGDKAEVLMRAPVPSQAGLGIGLYQAARQAELHGFRLRLVVNRPGRVCFTLEPVEPDRSKSAAAG